MLTTKEDPSLPKEIQLLSYQKRQVDLGKEYQLIMSALFALKLSVRDDIIDFELSTNNAEYGKFQNIVLKVISSNNQRHIFVLQLKYKKRRKRLTIHAFNSCRGRNNFNIAKYFGKLIETDEIDDITFLLLTNNRSGLKGNDKFKIFINTNEKSDLAEIQVKEIEKFTFGDFLIKSKGKEAECNIFQFFAVGASRTFKKFCKQFYFGSNQITIKAARLEIDNLLKTLLDEDVSDLFCLFMEGFWSKAFVLTRHDIIAKLVELTLSPWTRSISGEHINERTQKIVMALMKFDVIVVNETAKSVILNIWPDETNADNITEIKLKYQLTDKQQNKILWYANLVPLVVEITDENKPLINKVLLLLQKDIDKNKLLCIGDVNSINLSKRLVVQTLFDLAEQPDYKDIINCFNVSLQGRDAISLNKLLSLDSGIAQFIDIGMVFQLAQTETGTAIIEKKEADFPNPHIHAKVSTLFLDTEMILESYRLLSADSQLIINCDEEERKALLQHKNVVFVNYEEEFDEDTHEGASVNFILLLTDAESPKAVFHRVCQKSEKSNIYFLKIFSETCLSVIFVKGNIEELRQMKCPQQPIQQTEILKHFGNSLNVVCAPAGMGKSTLLKALSLHCPSEFWSLLVTLVDHNAFLKTKPEDEKMLQRFLGTDITNSDKLTTKVKSSLLKNKKLYIFLDGLDEVEIECVEHVLRFVKRVSSDINIWITCRESFQLKIIDQMNIVPMKIQEIERHGQKLFLQDALKKKYSNKEIEEILNIIFKSMDVITSRHLLSSPLHLFILAQNFCNSRDLYENKIILLTTILKMFLVGYIQFFCTKLGKNVNKFVRKFISDCLIQYELIASKTYLREEICAKLNLNLENTEEFLKNIQQEGDRLGIIKNTDYSNKAEFIYPEIGAYLACSLLAKNLDKLKVMRVLNEGFFQEHYNLRPLIDIMFAEENPLHLAVIYNDMGRIQENINRSLEQDKLGRYALHLACSLGNFQAVEKLTQNEAGDNSLVTKESIKYAFREADSEERNDSDDIGRLKKKGAVRTILLRLRKPVVTDEDPAYDGTTTPFDLKTHRKDSLRSKKITSSMHTSGIKKKITTPNIGIDVADGFGYRPLHVASENGSKKIVRLLMKSGAAVNLVDEDGRTPLHLACKNGHTEIATLLVAAEADINLADKNGCTPLDAASEKKHTKVVDLLIETNAQYTSRYGYTPLHIASMNGQVKVVESLIKSGVNINLRDKNGCTPLSIASENGQDKIVGLLIDSGANINLMDKYHHTPLYLAAKNGHERVVELLLLSGASFNLADKDGFTPLYVGSMKKHERILGLLLAKSGAEVDLATNSGSTPLHIALERGYEEIAELLIKSGARIDVVYEYGCTPLHVASKKGYERTVELLVKLGAKINVTDKDGCTPLYLACEQGHEKVVGVLLAAGAEMNLASEFGKTPLEVASKKRLYKIVELLSKFGAEN